MDDQRPDRPPERPHTRYGLYIARVVTINTLLIIVGVAYSNMARKYQITRIEDAATVARAKADILEQQLLDFMERTVKRMDALQEFNPNLNVPRGSEPQPPGKRELSKDELQRPNRVSATPTMTPTPRPRPRIVIKYRTAPTPKPSFHW